MLKLAVKRKIKEVCTFVECKIGHWLDEISRFFVASDILKNNQPPTPVELLLGLGFNYTN